MIKLIYGLWKSREIHAQSTKSRLGVTINQKGQVLVVVFFTLGVVLFTVLSVIAGAQIYFQNASYSADAEKATALAEAGVDKALNSLNRTGGTYNGETETALGVGTYSVTITTKDAATKIIESTGYIPDKAKPRARRTINITASKGVGVSFVYGVQVGEGGLQLGNNNTVQGSVYSNGNITMGNNNTITGDAWVAGGPQSAPDQQTDCSGSNCSDFIFGKVVNGQLDVAQSFQPTCMNVPTCALPLNNISVKLKKFGNPPDETVRIMRDNNGQPDKGHVLAYGTLYSSLVTTDYGWIDVSFNISPVLSSNTTYWILIDTTANNSNYWSWQNDLAKSYGGGQLKWSPKWDAGNPSWNGLITDGDLSFKTVMGGGVTAITAGSNDNNILGNAHANTIENLNIAKDAYYYNSQTLINTTVQGTKYPNSADPAPKVFPISDANVNGWKQQAETAGVYNGNITNCPASLNSQKIVGSVNLNQQCSVTVRSPIWITGNLTLGEHNTLTLDSTYGATSGVIIVDGTITLGNTNKLQGTGVGSSLLMALSSFDSVANGGVSAIKIGNDGNSGVYYASKGIIEPGNNNQYKELTAWQIKLTNDSVINYETGLSSSLFSSGPSGSFSLVKGTYQVK